MPLKINSYFKDTPRTTLYYSTGTANQTSAVRQEDGS